MKTLKLKWFLSLIFILGSALPLPAAVTFYETFTVDGVTYGLPDRYSNIAYALSATGEDVYVPDDVIYNGHTSDVTCVGYRSGGVYTGFEAPDMKRLSTPLGTVILSDKTPLLENLKLEDASTIYLTGSVSSMLEIETVGVSAVYLRGSVSSMLEVETTDAGTVIYIGSTETGFSIPSLTVRGAGGEVMFDYADSGIVELESIVFDCDDAQLSYSEKSDYELSDLYRIGTATLTDNVKTVSGVDGFSLAEKLDIGDGDFESVSDYAFRNCTIESFKVNSGTGVWALENAVVGRLDVSERIGYVLRMKSIGTLFVGDDVVKYTMPENKNTAYPVEYEGASLREIEYEFSVRSNPVWYDFDGDGKMSLVTDYSGSKAYYRGTNYEPLGEIAATVGNTRTNKGIHRALDYDKSGIPSVFINEKSSFKYDPETDGFTPIECPGYLILDADNNGLTDFYRSDNDGDDHYIFHRQTDGTYLKSKMHLTTNKEDVYNATYEVDNTFRLPSLANGWIIGGGIVERFDNINIAIDLNKDGMPDLIDNNKGGILYNIGGNDYYASTESGAIYQCDLNGDGMLDYVLLNKQESKVYLMMYQQDGTYSQRLLVENQVVNNVYCKDFDHDGDIDILLPISYSSRVGFSMLAFFINDGNGGFRLREQSFTEAYDFVDCMDVDADGFYEIIASADTDGNYNSFEKTVMLDSGTDFFTFEIVDLFDMPIYTYGIVNASENGRKVYILGDVDNDGFTDFYFSNFRKMGFGDRQNTAPEKMAAPVAYYDDASGKLRITWEAGSDAETSACDLTYELRIGTTHGKADILATNSLADGRRRTLEDGNMGRNLYNLFNPSAMDEGTYYIAVQAIDAGGLGGAWSDDAVYQHKKAVADFSISHSEMTTADTLQLAARRIDGATYKWDIADGTVISGEGNRIGVTFNSYGEREIGLTITLADGSTLTADAKTVDVLMFGNVDEGDIFIDENGCGDFNFDGYIDGFTRSPIGQLIYNDGKGNFAKVGKLFNSDLGGYVFGVLDINKDGYLDFMIDADKGNVYINSGYDDFSFEYKTQVFSIFDPDTNELIERIDNLYASGEILGDINNDGFPERMYSDRNRGFFNVGTGNFEFYEMSFETPRKYIEGSYWNNPWRFCDINRDGFIDVITIQREDDVNDFETSSCYAFIKDPTGGYSFEDAKLMFEVNDRIDPGVCDLNSDGYLDLFYRKSGENFIRVIPGKPESEWPCTEEVRIPLVGDYEFSVEVDDVIFNDYDNNGYPDIRMDVVDGSATSAMPRQGILLMQPDFKAELCRIDGADEQLPFIALSDGAYPQIGYEKTVGRSDNQAPERPAGVMAKQTSDGMLITWGDAKDDHTPAMQMRYNVSVKKKGATGENSFVISPMNALSDEATVVPSYMYKKSTRMTVPSEFLEAGQTYEVQIQAIDAFNEHSPMTEPVEITISAAGYIDAADKVAKGAETTLKYVGTQASSFSYELDGGTLVTDKGNGEITAKWDEPGVKEITLTAGGITINSAITVVDLLDVDFALPENPLAGAPIEVEVPEAMLDNSRESGFRCDDERVTIEWSEGDSIAVITFAETGTYTIESYVEDGIQGNTCRREVVVAEAMPLAEIAGVTADATGHYTVSWNTAGMPQQVGKAVISRETNRLDNYVRIGEANVSDGVFIDMESDPAVKSERYIINLVADNGQESYASDPHQPLHVMINLAASGGYNLMWNSYEGLDVDYYTIMRGTSANSLTELAQVSGNNLNYTDMSVPEGEMFYSVIFTPVQPGAQEAKSAPARAGQTLSSNVVSTKDAISATYATSLRIFSVEGDMELSRDRQSLHLFAEMYPLSATFNRVSWGIDEGGELATIDNSGLLTTKRNGGGTVVVRATALDGSGLTATCEVTVIPTMVERIDLNERAVALDQEETFQLVATVYPLEADNKSVAWTSSDESIATVDENGLVTAIDTGLAVVTVSALDGSGETAECNVSVRSRDAESISLNEDELDLKTGEAFQLTATVLPENADDRSVTWKSDNPAVAKVDDSGYVQAMSPGTAVITATNSGGIYLLSASCTVTVTDPIKLVESITLDSTDLTLTVNRTVLISASVQPMDATNREVEWTSSDENVAIVNENGLMMAVGIGEADIIASAVDGSGVSATCHVTVVPTVARSISLDKSELLMNKGDVEQLRVTVLPESTTDKSVTWTSSDEDVVDVYGNGSVVAMGEGTADVTATTNDGSNLSATCKVTVIDPEGGISGAGADGVNVSVKDGRIIVTGKGDDEIVTVHTLEGRLVYRGTDNAIDVYSNIYYLVTVRHRTFEVLVP